MALKLFFLALGLIAANYLSIALGISDFDKALDRSFFQALALALAYWNVRERPIFENR